MGSLRRRVDMNTIARQLHLSRVVWMGAVMVVCFLLSSALARGIPVITAFEPQSGAPGTSVTIRGADLGGVFEVLFGSGLANFTVRSSDRIVATVPLDATTGPISVAAPSGGAITIPHFRVAPLITGVFPEEGPVGAPVLLEGLNFEGATAVQFNKTNATFFVTSPSQIRATVPVGATNGPITVTTPIGSAESFFDFIVTGGEPFIDRFAPEMGKPGDIVTINGGNFTGVTGVGFHDRRATFSITSASQIRATVPASASSGYIYVTNAFGVAESLDLFLVTTAPVILQFEPFGGPAGTPIVIRGRNFTGATAVRFGGVNASFAAVADTQINATVPNGATNAPITVVSPGGTGVSTESFLASAGPIVVEFSPASGAPRTLVTVNGYNFTGAQRVQVNGVNASFSVVAATQLNLEVPANATTGPITVTSAAGTGISYDWFVVRTGKPMIFDFDPEAGQGRTAVIIEGVDLTGATSVKFNNQNAQFSAVADSQILATVPDGATSGPISVTTRNGSVVSSNRFIVAPVIASFTPTNGVPGTVVRIRGTNLADVTVVRFKEASAVFEIVSTNELSAVVPTNAISGWINVISRAGIVAADTVFGVLPQVNRFEPSSGLAGTQVTIFGAGFSDVTAVRFGNVNATFQVISSSEIRATVPQGAATGPITVVTIAGSATSLRSFVVGTTAELALSQAVSTNVALLNQVLAFTVTVTNQGPSAASSVVLSNRMPAAVSLVSVVPSQGTYTRTGSDIRVNLGSVARGAKASVVVTVLTEATGTITNTAAVSAHEVDSDLLDNASELAVSVVDNVANLQITRVNAGTLRLSWPAAAGSFGIQSTTSLAPPRNWQAVAATPVQSGDRFSVTLPVPGRTTFYRLFRP